MPTMLSAGFADRAAWARLADYLAVAVAITLPWSVSATSIAVVLWLLALLPTLVGNDIRREVSTWAGGLPVALFLFGAIGMLWADVTFVERWRGLDSFIKLLVIPLLFVQFRRSEHGLWPLMGFLASTGVLLAVSFVTVVTPNSLWTVKSYGVPVKDYIAQAAEFTLCAFGALYLALQARRAGHYLAGSGWALLCCAFLANILLVTTSRTALVTIPVLLALFVVTQFRGKARIAMVAAGIGAIAIAALSSPVVQERLESLVDEIRQPDHKTSAGERIEYWTKAVVMVRAAPVLGHGTGSIRDLYRRAAEGKVGVAAQVADNPHNQTLAVAIQLGLVGVLVLYAMWASQLFLFSGAGFASFVGLIIVVQNIVGSLFNSHIFDFTHGWIYVFGVGIAGGMTLASRTKSEH